MIGIFDSGSGGLSVLKEIRARLPAADILYLGDIANAPYGEKPPQELSALTVRNIQFLRSRGAARIVSACNSVSAALAVSLFDTLDIAPDALIEMVGPTVRHFRGRDERVLLCATPATVRAGLYQQGFGMAGKELATVAIPELAGAIEFGASEAELERIVHDAFADVPLAEGETLVLGCTHYPLVTPVFERVLGGAVRIFDPAHAVAARVEEQFGPHEAAGKGELRFAITKDSAPFRSRVASLWPESADAIEVIQ
ncbi:MAG TPA: aspartate/glutamate racemase family protein [Candidatus Paceibacterota bacterium]